MESFISKHLCLELEDGRFAEDEVQEYVKWRTRSAGLYVGLIVSFQIVCFDYFYPPDARCSKSSTITDR